jgi:two-component system sensor histidine kinase AtoS
MKKKIYIGLFFCSLVFILGGFYITDSIGHVISSLRNVITLHQVEILRENLLVQIKVVQSDLLLKDTPHARDLEIFVEHVESMAAANDICLTCHHIEPTKTVLENLSQKIAGYKKSLSGVYTLRANQARVRAEKERAFAQGQYLLDEVNKIVVSSSEKLAQRTTNVLQEIAGTRWLITLLVIGGPILGLLAVMYLVRIFTGSLAALLNATRRLQKGDLSYRVVGLRDEFGELADSFNDMSSSLVEQIGKIEENQKRYQLLFETAGDAIFILAAEGEEAGSIKAANKAAADMHGYTVEELLGLKIQDLDTPDSAAEAPGRIRRILAGERINAEVHHRKKDGTVFPVEVNAGLMEFEGQKYILAFDRNITERKLAQRAFQQAQQLAICGEMATGLAHEIKNPLAGIKVSIQVLASELKLNPENQEVFSMVVNEINRIETLLRDLLAYARPHRAEFAPVDINKILEGTMLAVHVGSAGDDAQALPGRAKDITLVKQLSSDLPMVKADSAQLQQIFLNLLLNAVDAVAKSGTITVETGRGPHGTVLVRIADTGRGADEKTMQNLFKPFYSTKPKGTGLGLAICKRLVGEHHGEITAINNPGGGMIFTIELPLDAAGKP